MRVKPLIGLTLVLMLSASGVGAREYETEEFVFPADDIETLDVLVSLGAGQFDITTEKMDDIARARVEYDPRRIEVFAEYEKRGSVGFLEFESDQHRIRDIDNDSNLWDIVLSDRYPTEMEINIGACRSEIDLSGLPLKLLSLDVGAAEGRIIFGRPNPIEADEIIINAGAASFSADKLGNAAFRRLTFEGGVGSFELDFSGEYKTRARARISIGLGSATIIIPRDLPVRVEADDGFLSSVEIDDGGRGEYDDDYYESDDFRDADIGLSLSIDVGLGSVEVIFED